MGVPTYPPLQQGQPPPLHQPASSTTGGKGGNLYKCSKCGQPKRNHLCQALTDSDGGGAAAKEGEAANAAVQKPVWTRKEDAIIMQGVREHGPKWNEIAQNMPGRTSHAVRNRWHRLQRFYQEQHGADLAQLLASSSGLQQPTAEGGVPMFGGMPLLSPPPESGVREGGAADDDSQQLLRTLAGTDDLEP